MTKEIEELEELRLSAVRSMWVFVFALIWSIIFAVFCLLNFSPIFLPLPFIVVFIYHFRGGKAEKEYKHKVKEVLIGSMFRKAFDNVETDYEKGLSKEIIRDTELMSMGNRYRSDDYISGSLRVVDTQAINQTERAVHFSRADVYIAEETTDSEGNTSTTVYFQGRWMIFEFPKRIANDLQIIAKQFHHAQVKSSIFTRKEERRHKVALESMEFNRSFKVYAQEDQDAFYVLTPQLMEKIDDYCRELGDKVMIGLIDNQLHVAINTRENPMEPNVYRKPDYQKMQAEIKYEIKLIKKTIEMFSLDVEYFQGQY